MATTVTTTRVASAHAADDLHHTHGEMDTRAHERTFDGFVRFLTWNVVAVIVVLIFLALTNA